jgi:DNA-binding CsgD family transcriptional regulator
VGAGRFAAAEGHFDEANEISIATGTLPILGTDLLVLAWRGREADAHARAAALTYESTEVGQGVALTFVQYALTILELGLGHYDAALVSARRVYEEDPLSRGTQVLPDLIEAAVRSNDPALAASALDRFAGRAAASGTAWALGLLARSRALLADDSDAESLYEEAIEQLERCEVVLDLARANLLYGEWLRRQRRRRDAREQLRVAYERFASFGAGGFAERARVELLATGERARERTVETLVDLTPQEAHIARLAADGASNADIAAQLFISASTVEYHLRKVFKKLGLNSRTQLARSLPR